MGRQRNNQRKREAAINVPNYKSRTKPSFKTSRKRYKKKHGIGRPYYRFHYKRTKLKSSLAQELGVPANTKFIFRFSLDDQPDLAAREPIEIDFGTVVVINQKDLSLVLAYRATPFFAMSPQLKEKFRYSTSETFQHARDRNTCKSNSATQGLVEDEDGHTSGWMGCCGWRGGSDKGRSVGWLIFSLHLS